MGDTSDSASVDLDSHTALASSSMADVVTLRNAQTLGTLGLLPFFAQALLCWLPDVVTIADVPAARLAQMSLVAYSATILAFLGAVPWGIALFAPLNPPQNRRRYLDWGVIPAILGWLALLMMFVGIPAWVVLAFLIADLWLVRLMDGVLLRGRTVGAERYLELRGRMTWGATLALAIALIATL